MRYARDAILLDVLIAAVVLLGGGCVVALAMVGAETLAASQAVAASCSGY